MRRLQPPQPLLHNMAVLILTVVSLGVFSSHHGPRLAVNAMLQQAPPQRSCNRYTAVGFAPNAPFLQYSSIDSLAAIKRRAGTVLYDTETQTEIMMPILSGNGAAAPSNTLNGVASHTNGTLQSASTSHTNGVLASQSPASFSFSFLDPIELLEESPTPTSKGGYSHTSASKAKISAANKGKTPWNKGKTRSEAVRARIAAGVRAKNRVRFVQKLEEMGVTEEEYDDNKRKDRREKEAERRARRTENGGYRPTEETKQKISQILKEKYAKGEYKPRTIDPSKVRRGFKHSEETRKKISDALRKRWADDPSYRANMVEKSSSANTDLTVREKISQSLRKKWQDPEFRAEMMAKMAKRKGINAPHDSSHREKISAAMRAKWQDDVYRKKALEGIAKRKLSMASSTQPTKPRASASSSSRASKPMAPKKPVVKASAAAASMGTAAAASLGTAAISKTPITPSPSALMMDGMQQMAPRTIPREPKKKRGRAKGTKNKPKPAVKNAAIAAVQMTPKKAMADQKPAAPKIEEEDDEVKASKAKPNGSVSLMREERRDLYDLLYGDEDDSPTSGETMNLPLGDDNLDAFDPYGLEDF